MKLNDIIIRNIDKIPRVRITIPFMKRYILHNTAKTQIFSNIRPKNIFWKLKVEKLQLLGAKTYINGAHIYKFGGTATVMAEYVNTSPVPHLANVKLEVDGSITMLKLLMGPNTRYQQTHTFTVTEPKQYEITASISPTRPTIEARVSDSLTINVAVGLFDNRLKPVSEYPVSGAENAKLDIPYSFTGKTYIYPQQLPNGITINSIRATPVSGIITFEGQMYRHPLDIPYIELLFRVRNTSGADYIISYWGTVAIVIYDDPRYASLAEVTPHVPKRYTELSLRNNSTTTIKISIPIPTQFYGYVLLGHLMKMYSIEGSSRMFTYAGGVFTEQTIYRILLP